MIPLPACLPRNCISYLWYWIQNTGTLFNWRPENVGCALLVTAQSQFMPCVKHLPFAKAERPPEKHSQPPALSQLGEARIKRQSLPVGQGHRLQNRSLARFLVKGRESYIWKQKYFILLPWLFTTLSTGNEFHMSCRKDTSRNFACKSFSTELRNLFL